MANPQRENGYTGIANEILSELAREQLNGTQFRIVLVVFRFTYGFQRKEHELSESFISKATSIHKQQIKRELKELILRKILTVAREAGPDSSRVIGFNKNYDEWEGKLKRYQVAKKIPGSGLDTTPGSEKDTTPGSGLDTQERNNLKKILKEKDIYSQAEKNKTAKAAKFPEAIENEFEVENPDSPKSEESLLGSLLPTQDTYEEADNNMTPNKEKIPYKEIVEYLNFKAQTSYRHSSTATQKHIKARWNEGFRLDDFKRVIDNKVASWLNDHKWSKFLRPETLFSNKFEGYLNEKPNGGYKPKPPGSHSVKRTSFSSEFPPDFQL